MDAMRDVDAKKTVSQQIVMDAMRDVDAKKTVSQQVVMGRHEDGKLAGHHATLEWSMMYVALQALKADPLLMMERSLMSYFHTDGSRLRHLLNELASRVDAQAVK